MAIEEEMVGWHYQLSGYEFEQTPADSEGQGILACCCPWGRKESDTRELLNQATLSVQLLASPGLKIMLWCIIIIFRL